MASYRNITASDILAAYAKHGDDFIIIDPKTIVFNASGTVAFTKFIMKLANDTVCIPSVKFFNQKVSKIRSPDERDYETIKTFIRRDNDEDSEDNFGKALDQVSVTFTKIVKRLRDDCKITDDADVLEEYPESVIIPSCKINTPVLRRGTNKDGKMEAIANPLIFINLATKRYSTEQEERLPALDGIVYKKSGKKFLIKEFDFKIYDMLTMVNNSPELARVNGKHITNVNVHEFITRGSMCSGLLRFDITISNTGGFNLKYCFKRGLYVVPSDGCDDNKAFDADDMSNIKITRPVRKQEVEEDEEDSKFEACDDDASAIDALSL